MNALLVPHRGYGPAFGKSQKTEHDDIVHLMHFSRLDKDLSFKIFVGWTAFLLRHPLLRPLLLARLIDRHALVAGLRGPERIGRGPVVLVVLVSTGEND